MPLKIQSLLQDLKNLDFTQDFSVKIIGMKPPVFLPSLTSSTSWAEQVDHPTHKKNDFWRFWISTFEPHHIMRKSVFGVFNQVRLKLACVATEAS